MGTGVETTPGKDRATKVAELITSYQASIVRVLPTHLAADRIVEQFGLALRETPALIDCSLPSLFGSIFECAKLGLVPNTHLGHAYLIPFNNSKKDNRGEWVRVLECQLVIGYQGFLELTRRSGEIMKTEARAVFAGDKFEWCYGTDPKIEHQPTGEEDPNKLKFVYAISWLRSGVTQFDVMNLQEVMRIKACSKAAHKAGSPWNNHFTAMAKKTAIRRLCKVLPLSDNLARAVELDEDVELLNRPQKFDLLDIPTGMGETRPGKRSIHDLAATVAAAYEAQPPVDDDDEPSQESQEEPEDVQEPKATSQPSEKPKGRERAGKPASGEAKGEKKAELKQERKMYPLHSYVLSCGLIDDDQKADLQLIPTDEQPAELNRMLGVDGG